MGLSLTKCKLKVDIGVTLTNTVGDGTPITDPVARSVTNEYTDGTGVDKAQLVYHSRRALATTTGETLDIRNLTMALDAAFGTYTFSKVKAIYIEVETPTAGFRLEVGAADANQFAGASQPLKDASDIVRVPARGRWFQESPVDGFTVDATHKDLKIYNPSGNSVTYRIIIIGEGTAA